MDTIKYQRRCSTHNDDGQHALCCSVVLWSCAQLTWSKTDLKGVPDHIRFLVDTVVAELDGAAAEQQTLTTEFMGEA